MDQRSNPGSHGEHRRFILGRQIGLSPRNHEQSLDLAERAMRNSEVVNELPVTVATLAFGDVGGD
jgi:hypothetical protein